MASGSGASTSRSVRKAMVAEKAAGMVRVLEEHGLVCVRVSSGGGMSFDLPLAPGRASRSGPEEGEAA